MADKRSMEYFTYMAKVTTTEAYSCAKNIEQKNPLCLCELARGPDSWQYKGNQLVALFSGLLEKNDLLFWLAKLNSL